VEVRPRQTSWWRSVLLVEVRPPGEGQSSWWRSDLLVKVRPRQTSWWRSDLVRPPGGGQSSWWRSDLVRPPGGGQSSWWRSDLVSPPGGGQTSSDLLVEVSPPGGGQSSWWRSVILVEVRPPGEGQSSWWRSVLLPPAEETQGVSSTETHLDMKLRLLWPSGVLIGALITRLVSGCLFPHTEEVLSVNTADLLLTFMSDPGIKSLVLIYEDTD